MQNKDTFYVAELSNGNYFNGGFGESETLDVFSCKRYIQEWQYVKDRYLHIYAHSQNLTYKIRKVQATTTYEFIDEEESQ